jgi:hypothetical protein
MRYELSLKRLPNFPRYVRGFHTIVDKNSVLWHNIIGSYSGIYRKAALKQDDLPC